MTKSFLESTLVLLAVAVILISLLAASGTLSGPVYSAGSSYVPVSSYRSSAAMASGGVGLNLKASTQVVETPANIEFGIATGE